MQIKMDKTRGNYNCDYRNFMMVIIRSLSSHIYIYGDKDVKDRLEKAFVFFRPCQCWSDRTWFLVEDVLVVEDRVV